MGDERAIRIGIDATAAVTQGGGIGRYTRELVGALGNEPGNYTYRLFSARQPAELPVPEPIPQSSAISYRQAPLSAQWLYRVWYRLRLPLPVQLFTGTIDLFHSPDFVLPPVLGDIPTLLTVHDLSFLHYPETFTPALVNYLNRVVPWSVERATHVVADSEATKRDLVNLWHVEPEKISVLYSGVHERFQPVTDDKVLAQMRQRYGLGEAPYILSVGTVQPRKNYEMLIRALKRVADKCPHNLVIAGGQGWLYDQVMDEVREQRLEERVRFTGFVDDADLPALYSESSLFVFPSLYEGFGLPLLEAMACGVPVLTSNASSLPEVAGTAAMQLPPTSERKWARAMLQVLGDSELRVHMVAAGFRQVRRFSWQKAARELRQIYARLLE